MTDENVPRAAQHNDSGSEIIYFQANLGLPSRLSAIVDPIPLVQQERISSVFDEDATGSIVLAYASMIHAVDILL